MTSATVSSALSDLYYALSAGLNGLAGPLHGLANQECLGWILETIKKFNGLPTDSSCTTYAWETLNSGHVVPGYGHAVLRDHRPALRLLPGLRQEALHRRPGVRHRVARVRRGAQRAEGSQKIKDPWPNVDAGSGALLYHYGMQEFPYYTVLFSISRAMGICAQSVIARGLGLPITRPKSVTTKWITAEVTKA